MIFETNGQPKITRASLLRDQVYESLRARIWSRDIPNGTRLVEDSLAEQLGVSRTPVREAIRRLQIEGLVVVSGGRGYEVADIGKFDLEGALDIRELLEGYAVRKAAENINNEQLDAMRKICQQERAFLEDPTDDHIEELNQLNSSFHDLIIQCANNHTLKSLTEQDVIKLSAYKLYSFGQDTSRKLFAESHKRIVDCLARRDPDAAAMEASLHIDLLRKEIYLYNK